MAEHVNPKRRYQSPRRREQAAATRLHILHAAQRLFEQHGYPATTMAAIAAEAGVALKTVYIAFQTIRLNARNSRAVKTRIGALLQVIRGAAPTDADIAALWDLIQTDFYDNQRAIVEQLHHTRSLRPDLDVTRATDILWTLNHPDVWQLLVGARGWTPEQYEQWFGDTACAQLLRRQ